MCCSEVPRTSAVLEVSRSRTTYTYDSATALSSSRYQHLCSALCQPACCRASNWTRHIPWHTCSVAIGWQCFQDHGDNFNSVDNSRTRVLLVAPKGPIVWSVITIMFSNIIYDYSVPKPNTKETGKRHIHPVLRAQCSLLYPAGWVQAVARLQQSHHIMAPELHRDR